MIGFVPSLMQNVSTLLSSNVSGFAAMENVSLGFFPYIACTLDVVQFSFV